jgi:WhiB family redox-sensing transcriptional regulator
MREVRMMVSDDWMDFALCKEMPAEVFFPHEDDELAVFNAKKICMRCPVSEPCLEMGMKLRYGIWGGLTATERSMLRTLE